MPLFLFHLHECGDETADPEGNVFAGGIEARAYAVKTARDIMCAEVKEGRLCLACYILIEHENGLTEKVPFRDAVAITGLSG